jgi:hypothetical protein
MPCGFGVLQKLAALKLGQSSCRLSLFLLGTVVLEVVAHQPHEGSERFEIEFHSLNCADDSQGFSSADMV